MPGFTLKEVIEATSGRVLFRGKEQFSGVSIDSRSIAPSELFIALRGARFDGHDFLQEAIRRGAGAIVTYPPTVPVNGSTIIHVGNTLKALQDLAKFNRDRKQVKIIGITGTNGKTTTKEMLYEILKSYSSVMCSSGNLNNQIGLPLSLLKLDQEELCVLEMGASKRGDIRELCEISSPDIAVITNVGPGHLEGFGSLDIVRDTKLELADYAGTVVINADDEMLAASIEKIRHEKGGKVITYGIHADASVTARDIRLPDMSERKGPLLGFDLHVRPFDPVRVDMKVPGVFNVYNALAAAAASSVLDVPPDAIRRGLETFAGVSMRLEIKEMKGAVVISDVYNANPASMEEAVKELVRVREGKAIAVLGDMLELGLYSEEAHRKLGSWLAELPIDTFVAVGPMMSIAADAFRAHTEGRHREVFTAADSGSAKDLVHGMAKKGDTILIKGSRGMYMETILGANGAV